MSSVDDSGSSSDVLAKMSRSYPVDKDDVSSAVSSTATADVNQSTNQTPESTLLPIIIDGSNVAMSHGNRGRFSCRGIKICVDFFRQRGHKEITVFVPMWRKETSKPETPTTDQHLLVELEKENILTFTPSRQVSGRRYVCHDDRYILNLAAENGGIVVSNDNYRELINEKPKFKEVIEERILMYSFVNDRFMPPDDPFGKNGPTLDQFLRKKVKVPSRACPYGKKCTYGNKCKYYHPDRATNQKSITDKLKEHSSQRINEVRARVNSRDSSPGDPLTRTRSMQPHQETTRSKQAVTRTKSSVPSLDHHWGTSGQQWPLFDTSIPPPLATPTPQTPPPSAPPTNTHAKLSRQLTLNPHFDPRIQNLHTHSDFSYPPPPPFSSPTPHHMVVTRNASEPDSYMQPHQAHQPLMASAHQQQPMKAPPLQDLHKTWSTPAMEGGVTPINPLIALPNRSVWEASGPCISGREGLYSNLVKLFGEELVRRAMNAMPHETDPKVLCKHILTLENSSGSAVATSGLTGNAATSGSQIPPPSNPPHP